MTTEQKRKKYYKNTAMFQSICLKIYRKPIQNMIYIQYLKIRERYSKMNYIFPMTLLTKNVSNILEVFYKKMDYTIKQLITQDISKLKKGITSHVPNIANDILLQLVLL